MPSARARKKGLLGPELLQYDQLEMTKSNKLIWAHLLIFFKFLAPTASQLLDICVFTYFSAWEKSAPILGHTHLGPI